MRCVLDVCVKTIRAESRATWPREIEQAQVPRGVLSPRCRKLWTCGRQLWTARSESGASRQRLINRLSSHTKSLLESCFGQTRGRPKQPHCTRTLTATCWCVRCLYTNKYPNESPYIAMHPSQDSSSVQIRSPSPSPRHPLQHTLSYPSLNCTNPNSLAACKSDPLRLFRDDTQYHFSQKKTTVLSST